MVPTPFTWRYGGRQVSLSGSFNGWREGIRLPLIEGSGTVFQIIIDLPPGCYQFRFLVDGTWRVDQQQICETDEHGIMNNIVLVNGNNFMFQDLNAAPFEASTSGNNEVMPSVGSSSGRLLSEPVEQLSDGDLDAFHRVLSTHLLSSTAYELIPKSGKVIALDIDVGVEEAFNVMYELGINSVPLWNESIGQMVGMLTASDFILVLLQLQRNRAMFADVDHEIRTISSWKAWKLQNYRDIVGTLHPIQRRPLIYAGPDESLWNAVLWILRNNISAVPIIQHSADGSFTHLLHIACLAGILRNICSHFEGRLGHVPLLQKPIGYIPIGTWAVNVRRSGGRALLTVHPNDPLSSALTLLLEAQISSVPVVDDAGNIINVYSRSDITALAKDSLYTRIQPEHMSVSQALEVINVTGRRTRYRTCTRFDSLYWVMQLLSEPDVRRIIVVEASTGRLEGVITLQDIFNYFCLGNSSRSPPSS
ncbi:sucrose nonfermenting 4-like protein isoform X2 [Andrographis paniculata]|uniref:sucrose nonfermenting 4-like protein isoform X2 n=1 Tax=Andrographis paniculata TaxID=175694 RepID=UPI0021E922FD|nr:sucrose nonfermenting 4-like protein isoform X2 [Andrographis paniculata]